MTRIKVSNDRRQRTAHACDSCKRRKQKCDGHQPCHMCSRRRATCHYSPYKSPKGICVVQNPSTASRRAHVFRPVDINRLAQETSMESVIDLPVGNLHGRNRASYGGHRQIAPTYHGKERDIDLNLSLRMRTPDAIMKGARATPVSVVVEPRFLQGSMGKLYFIGPSSTLALLETVRTIVQSTAGPCPFIADPLRYQLLDIPLLTNFSMSPQDALPDREDGYTLARSFFLQTYGMIEVLDTQHFWQSIESCYKDRLAANPSELCVVHLVLAIGSLTRGSMDHQSQHNMQDRLQAVCKIQSDRSFQAASYMLDGLIEPGQPDTWSIRALTLCTMYHLILSRRNAAEECHGRAVRSAIALGLQKSWDPSPLRDRKEITLRRRLWSSLFILDRFLAASLGRPLAIQNQDHPISLRKPHLKTGLKRKLGNEKPGGIMEASCRLGKILNDMSCDGSGCKGISPQHSDDEQTTDLNSDTPQIQQSDDPSQVMALLHWQLMDEHATMLQSRNFFLAVVRQTPTRAQETASSGIRRRTIRGALTPCVCAAAKSITLASDAYDVGMLPRRNPFLIYYIFTATLIILCGDLVGLQTPGPKGRCAGQGLMLLEFWARNDHQAERFYSILSSLEEVVNTPPHQNFANSKSTDTNGLCGSLTSETVLPWIGSGESSLNQSRLASLSPESSSGNLYGVTHKSESTTPRLHYQPEFQPSLAPEYTIASLGAIVGSSSFIMQSPNRQWGHELMPISGQLADGRAGVVHEETYGPRTEHSSSGPQLSGDPLGSVLDPALWDVPSMAEDQLTWPFYSV